MLGLYVLYADMCSKFRDKGHVLPAVIGFTHAHYKTIFFSPKNNLPATKMLNAAL